MIKQIHFNNLELKKTFFKVMSDIRKDRWQPDYIIGINRGGLIPGVWASHYLNIPLHTLNVCLRDFEHLESNFNMSKDAFGYDRDNNKKGYISNSKQILIFDDINDSGSTFKWIKEDWKKSCYPEGDRWNSVWGYNVRTAVLIDNLASDWEVDYSGFEINKQEENVWIVFDWEEL